MFNFDIKKVVQIINFLLEKDESKRLNYTKLIKLLYIADKEFLKKWDLTITGDSYISMNNGPVLSKIYDLVRDRSGDSNFQNYWNNFFIKDGYDLTVVHENYLTTDQLNKSEKEMLSEIYETFKSYDFTDMIDYTHDKSKFPEVEWDKASGSYVDLDVEEILKSIGRNTEEIQFIENEIKSQLSEASFFPTRTQIIW